MDKARPPREWGIYGRIAAALQQNYDPRSSLFRERFAQVFLGFLLPSYEAFHICGFDFICAGSGSEKAATGEADKPNESPAEDEESSELSGGHLAFRCVDEGSPGECSR